MSKAHSIRTARSLRKLNPKQFLVLGFLGIILIGTVLLSLPIASRNREALAVLDALFTATSATCVTGLVIADTWTYFSGFGQFVILLLIQTGGLGFMTIAIIFSMILGKKIGLRDRSFLMESVNALQLGGIVKLVRRILIGTMAIETIGAILLSLRFVPIFGWRQGVWYGVFHSVSAFCNAGFDLMGIYSPYASLTPFVNDPLVNGTIMILIIFGGIGFVVWDDLVQNRWKVRKCNLHTRITLSWTAALLLVSALVLIIVEWNAGFHGLPASGKILAGFFQAVTPRTAGFNTVAQTGFSDSGILLMLLLMIVGAGPGSTGGGIKTTTFAVISLAVLSQLRGSDDVEVLGRRLANYQIKRAFTTSAHYIGLGLTGCLVILATQNVSMTAALFESFSAIGTVGLSLGITGELVPISRLVIIALMALGRLGSITVFLAIAANENVPSIRLPEEKIIV